ncbi:MAG TPA: 30S ribosomal protein S3ae [Candidatus Thermoplasmatota archaeon]|nr:30S ribosomal protein S3ae [Candidatus Thermoplasmatota archaeon]
MAKAAQASRTVQKKVKDKWKAKQWYRLLAPKLFNETPVGEAIADEPEKLAGRIVQATLQDLTGDFSKMHVKVHFKVVDVHGTDAKTRFVGHELTSDYLRRLTRRKHSKIDMVVDVQTKDGFLIRVKPMAITEKRAQASQETEIRNRATEVIRRAGTGKSISEFVRDILSGDLAMEIYKVAKPILPVKRVDIRKCDVLKEPAGPIEEVEIFPQETKTTPKEVVAVAAGGSEVSQSAPAPERAEEELTEEERVAEERAPEEEL